MGDDCFAVKVSADGANWTTGLTLESDTGIANFPTQPHFTADMIISDGWQEITTPHTDLIFDTIVTDPGGHFDPVTGAFTVPATGVYALVLSSFLHSSTNGRVSLGINGFTQFSPVQLLVGVLPLSFKGLETLNKGDQVTMRTGPVNEMLRFHEKTTTFSGWKVA